MNKTNNYQLLNSYCFKFCLCFLCQESLHYHIWLSYCTVRWSTNKMPEIKGWQWDSFWKIEQSESDQTMGWFRNCCLFILFLRQHCNPLIAATRHKFIKILLLISVCMMSRSWANKMPSDIIVPALLTCRTCNVNVPREKEREAHTVWKILLGFLQAGSLIMLA